MTALNALSTLFLGIEKWICLCVILLRDCFNNCAAIRDCLGLSGRSIAIKDTNGWDKQRRSTTKLGHDIVPCAPSFSAWIFQVDRHYSYFAM